MKQYINEAKRMQFLAGILNESQLNEEQEVTPEQAAQKALTVVDDLENNSEINKVADKIANDPKASKQLMDLLAKFNISLNENANLDPAKIKNIALALAKKAETIQEEDNYGGALLGGLVAGGTLAHYLFSVTTADFVGGLTHTTTAMPETIIGAIIGAALAVIGKKVYDKISGND
jgi:hypothetical protein